MNSKNELYNDINIALKMSITKRKKLLKFFQSMPLSDQSLCLEAQLKESNKLKNRYSSNIRIICSFYRAIVDFMTSCHVQEEVDFSLGLDTKKLINFFIKQDIIVQIEIFQEQKNQFFKSKNNCTEKYLLLSSFYKAIDIYFVKFNTKFFKNKTYSLKSQKNIININILKDKKQKISIKREKFLNYISIVKRLKNEGYSYRKMSLHFKKFYNFTISHTYLKKMVDKFLVEGLV